MVILLLRTEISTLVKLQDMLTNMAAQKAFYSQLHTSYALIKNTNYSN